MCPRSTIPSSSPPTTASTTPAYALHGALSTRPSGTMMDRANLTEPSTSDASLARRVVRGSLWIAGTSYLNLGVGLMVNIVLTRVLLPADFGRFALAQFLFGLINIRPKTGLGPAFAQRKDTTGALVATHLALDLSAAAVTCALSVALAPLLHRLGYSWEIAWLVVALAIVGISDGLMGTAWTLLDKNLRLGQTSRINTGAFLLSYVPALWLAFHHGSYWSLVAQNAVYSLLLLAGLWRVVLQTPQQLWSGTWRIEHSTAIALLRFGLPIGATTVTGLLVAQLDNFYVGTVVGVAALGLYTRAYNLAQWPSRLVTNVISQAAFYMYARVQDDRARLEHAVTLSIWVITTLALPLALAIFVAAPDLVRQLYGPRWAASAVYLRFLVVYSAVGPLLGDAGWLFIAVGKSRITLAISAMQGATLGALGLVLTLHGGVTGTCVAVGGAFVVGLIVTYRSLRSVVRLRLLPLFGIPACAVLITLAGYLAGVRLLDPHSSWPPALAIVVKMGYTTCAYGAVLFLLQPRETVARARYLARVARHDYGVLP